MMSEKSAVLRILIQKTPPPYGIFLVVLWINKESESIHVDYVNNGNINEDNKDEEISFEKYPGGSVLYGEIPILKELLRDLKEPLKDKETVIKWAEYTVEKINTVSVNELESVFLYLEEFLLEKKGLTGDCITQADWIVWGALRGNVYAQGIIKKNVYTSVNRWYRIVESDGFVSQGVQLLMKEITSRKARSKGKNPTANYDIGLQNAIEGKVVTRFPPEPSGYMHIGHAKAAILNEYFARKYKGKLIVRFDDTNPSKEKEEFQEAILKDLDSLGIKADQISFSSDYFDKTYDFCIQMIKDGNAYADDTDKETMRAERMQGIESKRRQRSIEENLEIFSQMTKATEIGLLNCIRAKISVNSPNKALRDPVIYRCNTTPHHKTGTIWKVYPTYDFCCPIVDSIEGVTHALRTNEYKDRNAQYQWMIKALNLRKVYIWEFSRVNFVRTLLSKRKLQQFVDDKRVSGWDDPRMPTILGIRRRGMTIDALKQFIISQGPSKNVLNLDWSSIWAINKKIIDPTAPRYTAINSDNLVKVSITNGPSTMYIEERPKHKKNPQVGMKKVAFYKNIILDQEDALTFKDNEEITLMDWGNAVIKKIIKNNSGIIDSIEMELHLEGDFKATEKKITWLADLPNLIDVESVDFDYLILKDKLEEGDRLEDFLTPCTEFHSKIKVDENFLNLSKSDIIQLERKGYFICDQPCDSEGKGLVLFKIPDGKVVNKYGVKKIEN
ncbi:glutamate-tRNA ligase [Pneumocystis carinii B80]|uniref:glutamate--tRNA ligase n=1 Tax=Pneumocystis carinii (strain B80) TaxID=1408658 RepID=A0A0W4ZN45_PNEC8|nr:glutamate-tRNA ligase [Pneumocystis carinii B80]KTW29777.1 glutamate-tRNA ligase [Pneumocystis carinii B80]